MKGITTNGWILLNSGEFIHHRFCGQVNTFVSKKAEQQAKMIVSSIILVFFLLGAMAAPLCAQSYPSKPLRFILPYPSGGATDVLGRIIGEKYVERLGQPFVHENRPGAAGNIGMEYTAKARPDGYTIVLVSTSLAMSPSLYKKLNYDPIKDLAPISLVAEISNVLVVRKSLQVNSLKELVEYAKANPGKLNFGSGGIGTSSHLAGELLKSLAKINIVHVPYKGMNLAMIGVIGDEVDMMVTSMPIAMPQIQTGKVKVLAVLSNVRLPSLPNVPTAKEAGIDNFEVTAWYGILAPAGTSRDIISRLNTEWIKIAAMPDTKERMQKIGFEPMSSTPQQFAEFIKTETTRYAKLIMDANISKIDYSSK